MHSRDLDQLIARFAALPDAEVGSGPENDAAARRLDDWLATVPGLTGAADCVRFLRTWSGAFVRQDRIFVRLRPKALFNTSPSDDLSRLDRRSWRRDLAPVLST